MDWFPAVMGLVGVAVGVGIQEFRIWRERKDKYKDMIFEKRLETHQGAYYRCQRLVDFMMPDALVEDEGVKALIDELWEYKEWLDKNTLYLDGDSRAKINMLINYAVRTAKKYRDEEWIKKIDVGKETAQLHKNIVEVLMSIKRGVGVDYLPEEKVQIEDSYLYELFGEVVERAERRVKRKREKPEQKH